MGVEAFVYTDPYHGSTFLKKLYDLYCKQSLCDVTICVEDQEINAHRSVLAANSPYFEVMFTGSLMEAQQSKIHINEVTYTTIKNLVEFCYTASVKVSTDNALELLSASNMFQFEGIKQCCSTFLESRLDAQNCLSMMTYAELHTCFQLKENAEEFVCLNFCEVIKSEDFLQVSLEQITELIRDQRIVVRSEKDVFDALVAWVQHDEANRLQHFPTLIKLVRLADILPKILVDCIEIHPYVEDNLECIKFVNQTKSQHFLPTYRNTADKKIGTRLFKQEEFIYLIGGEIKHQVYDTVDRFSFTEKKWRNMAPLSKPRDGLGVAVYDGKIFAAGGYNGDSALRCCEMYNPDENSWSPIQPMSSNRHAFSMVELQGWLYAAGGSDFNTLEYNTVECYDPIRNEWFELAAMSSKREGLVLLPYDRSLYAIGGENGASILNTVERFDPRVGNWYSCASMGYRRRYFGASVLNNKIHCVGGSDFDEDLNSFEMFEARCNRWIPLPSMSIRREAVAAVTFDQKLFAIGGAFSNKEIDTIEVYDPLLNRWQEFYKMPRTKEGMGAVVV